MSVHGNSHSRPRCTNTIEEEQIWFLSSPSDIPIKQTGIHATCREQQIEQNSRSRNSLLSWGKMFRWYQISNFRLTPWTFLPNKYLCVVDRLINRLTDRVTGQVNNWLADWQIYYKLTDWPARCLADWIMDWLIDWLTDGLPDWLNDGSTSWLTDLLTVWLTEWWTD